jgi:SNF2 family DNA or RNA helicase
MSQFGKLTSNVQIEQLHEILKPYLVSGVKLLLLLIRLLTRSLYHSLLFFLQQQLRRMKENVEKSISAKEEIIIDVPLSAIQKKLYEELHKKNFDVLKAGE